MRVRTQYFRSLQAASGVLLFVTRCLWKILTTGLQCNYMHKDCSSAIDTQFPRPSSTADTSFGAPSKTGVCSRRRSWGLFCLLGFFFFIWLLLNGYRIVTQNIHVWEEFSLFPIITVNESLDVWRTDWDLWFFIDKIVCLLRDAILIGFARRLT